MKALMLVTLMLVACGTPPSEEKAVAPRTGQETCNRLGDYKYECLAAIKGWRIDPYASGACDRYTSAADTLTCMRIIAGGRYQRDAVEACDRFTQSPDTNRCLSATRNCRYAPSHVTECDDLSSARATIGCFELYCQPM